MIIGFCGRAGSGKDYAARQLQGMLANQNVKIYKLAEPIKQFCREVMGWTRDHTDGSLKEAPQQYEIVPRVAMQTLGTEWGRSLHPNIWIECLFRRIHADQTPVPTLTPNGLHSWVLPRVDVALVTDVRFPNEAKAIREVGGRCIYIVGPDEATSKFSEHASETETGGARVECDFCIDNSRRDTDYLVRMLAEIVDSINASNNSVTGTPPKKTRRRKKKAA